VATQPDRLNQLARDVTVGHPDAIYDSGYATLPRCVVCNRAVAEVDCDRDEDLPARLRMCFRQVDGDDSTCVEGLRP